MRKLFNWISKLLFDKKDALHPECEKVYKQLEDVKTEYINTDSKTIPYDTDLKDIKSGTYIAKPDEFRIEGNKITTKLSEEESKQLNNIFSEEIASSYVSNSKEVEYPLMGTFTDTETGEPKVRERPIKINEEKSEKIKSKRKSKKKTK